MNIKKKINLLSNCTLYNNDKEKDENILFSCVLLSDMLGWFLVNCEDITHFLHYSHRKK